MYTCACNSSQLVHLSISLGLSMLNLYAQICFLCVYAHISNINV